VTSDSSSTDSAESSLYSPGLPPSLDRSRAKSTPAPVTLRELTDNATFTLSRDVNALVWPRLYRVLDEVDWLRLGIRSRFFGLSSILINSDSESDGFHTLWERLLND
jgi:hypothetical protein